MKLLDTYKKFVGYKVPNVGTLYLRGYITNMSLNELFTKLRHKQYPKVEGCFSFVWHDADGSWCACVDHFSSYPLFYTDNDISPYYWELLGMENNAVENEETKQQMEFLGWFTVGPETFVRNIKRIEPGHYLINHKQIKHIDIARVADIKFDKDEVKHNFEQLIIKQSKDQNNMLSISGGKDSVTLGSIIKKLNLLDRFKFSTLYSLRSTLSDYSVVKRVEPFLGKEIKYMRQDVTSGHNIFNVFWKEANYAARREAILENRFEDCMLWTGEIGVGNMQAMPQITYASQMEHLDVEKIFKLHLNILGTYKREHCVNSVFLNERIKQYPDTYEYLLNYFKDRWNEFQTDNIVSKLIYLRLREESAWRCFVASQDPILDWFHPYADWNFISKCVAAPNETKFKDGLDKYLYIHLWGDDLCKIPWEYPKIGLNIPQDNRFRTR